MKFKWSVKKGPGLTDQQRRELLSKRLDDVNVAIDRYANQHLSSQREEELDAAIKVLHEQNIILLNTADEEQLVDTYFSS